MFTKIDESKRRKVNLDYDKITPSQQKAYYSYSQKYIKNKKILDVGCWTGRYASFANRFAKKVFGVDPNPEAISYARKSIPKASFSVGTVESLPFKDKFFDVVVFLTVIEHIPKGTELKALIEINRVLKKSGYLILDTANSNIFSILLDPAYFLTGHRHYSQAHLYNLLNKAGFRAIETYKRGSTLYQVTHILEMITKHILRVPLVFPDWMEKMIQKSYSKKGYAGIRVIAKREN